MMEQEADRLDRKASVPSFGARVPGDRRRAPAHEVWNSSYKRRQAADQYTKPHPVFDDLTQFLVISGVSLPGCRSSASAQSGCAGHTAIGERAERIGKCEPSEPAKLCFAGSPVCADGRE